MPDTNVPSAVVSLLATALHTALGAGRGGETAASERERQIREELRANGRDAEYPGAAHTLVVDEVVVHETDGVLYRLTRAIRGVRGDTVVKLDVERDRAVGERLARALPVELATDDDLELLGACDGRLTVRVATTTPRGVNRGLERLRHRVDAALGSDDRETDGS